LFAIGHAAILPLPTASINELPIIFGTFPIANTSLCEGVKSLEDGPISGAAAEIACREN
jgi:hypothetical protein